MQKKIFLNINGPPLVNMVTDLQMVFMDVSCRKCIDCMERAIKAYKTHNNIIKTLRNPDELHEQVLHLKSKRNRNKRNANKSTTEKNTTSKVKRTKPKKTKTITVTKYNVDGDVFALKVKETNMLGGSDQQNDTQVLSTCQVFSVKKSFPCNTPEGESFLTVAKRKVNKKNKKAKKEKEANQTGATTMKAHFAAPAFRKREVDNSQVPDNFMPSIEDLY